MNKNCDKYISPFRFQLLQSFPYIAEDFDQLTEYQLFCKLVEKINEVIGNENVITKEVNDMKDYLDSLDLQDEVNNKLDEMAESGELQEIIATYLNANALWCFDNVQSMKNATNLINGSFAKTLGYYSKNDGGNALYKIRTITNDDVVDEKTIIEIEDSANNLIAELINSPIMTPEMVGAYGDGETDDSNSIDLLLSGTYKNVLLNKNYLISEKVTIENSKSIFGNGKLLADFGTGNIVEIVSNNVTIKDITIEGDNSSNDSSNYGAIRCDNKTNIIIDNVTIKNVHGCGISFTGCSNSTINNCKITNTYATGIFMGGNGTNNNRISNNIIDTNRTQNGIFLTASPTSTSTTDYIYDNKIINNVVSNSNDTAIESGIHSVRTTIYNNKASNSNNPLILLRDTKDCKVYNNYLNATSSVSGIAVVPQTENASWNNEASIYENIIEGHFTRGGITTQQSGVIIKENLIKETETGVRGIMFGGALNNIELINNNIVGTYTYSIDFNYGGTDVTLSNIKINESVDLLKINNYKTTFANSNISFKNNIITKETFARYAGETLFKILQGNFATFRINIKSSEGEEYAIFNLINGTPTAIFNTSNIFFVSTGFSGWAITTNPSNTNNIIISRRGVDVTDAIINYEISNT